MSTADWIFYTVSGVLLLGILIAFALLKRLDRKSEARRQEIIAARPEQIREWLRGGP